MLLFLFPVIIGLVCSALLNINYFGSDLNFTEQLLVYSMEIVVTFQGLHSVFVLFSAALEIWANWKEIERRRTSCFISMWFDVRRWLSKRYVLWPYFLIFQAPFFKWLNSDIVLEICELIFLQLYFYLIFCFYIM